MSNRRAETIIEITGMLVISAVTAAVVFRRNGIENSSERKVKFVERIEKEHASRNELKNPSI